MSNWPSVTVLVAVKNVKRTIRRCMDSLLNLDYPNYSIYVMDEYSTDGSWEILKRYAKKYKKVRVKQSRKNVPARYNDALREIKTEYVALTDGDCVVDKNWLKELLKGFKEKDVLVCGGKCKTPKDVSELQKYIGIELDDRFKKLGKYPSKLPTMNMMFRTETGRLIGFDESLLVAYDSDFCFKVWRYGKIRYCPKALVYHYHRASWSSFFRQQFKTARYMGILYFKHKNRVRGDRISQGRLLIQPFLMDSSLLFFSLALLNRLFLIPAIILLLALFSVYVAHMNSLSKTWSDRFWFFRLFIVRTLAFGIGLPVAAVKLVLYLISKKFSHAHE